MAIEKRQPDSKEIPSTPERTDLLSEVIPGAEKSLNNYTSPVETTEAPFQIPGTGKQAGPETITERDAKVVEQLPDRKKIEIINEMMGRGISATEPFDMVNWEQDQIK